MVAERLIFDIFCVLVVNFMIDPSLRRLHWLEGARVHFCIEKAYISGLRVGGGGYDSPLSPPPIFATVKPLPGAHELLMGPALTKTYSMQPSHS